MGVGRGAYADGLRSRVGDGGHTGVKQVHSQDAASPRQRGSTGVCDAAVAVRGGKVWGCEGWWGVSGGGV